MASGLITSRQIEGGKVEAVTHYLFLSSKSTADGDSSQEIKSHLCLGRKALTNLGSLLKSRDQFANKGPYSQNYGFPVGIYGCESCTVKKAECERNDAFQLWCWRRLLKIPWTASRSNHSNRKESNPDYSLERLMLILQYFGHLI